MNSRSCVFFMLTIITSLACTISAREPSLTELREYLKNTADYKCWCEECKSVNDTHINFFLWWDCDQLLLDMLSDLENDEFSFDHIMASSIDLMFEKKEFCGDNTSTSSYEDINYGPASPNSSADETRVMLINHVNEESCIHHIHEKKLQDRIVHAEPNELYWIIPLISIVLLLNVVGGVYFYFRFAKIEAYHRYMERNEEVSFPLESFANTDDI